MKKYHSNNIYLRLPNNMLLILSLNEHFLNV